MPAVLWPAQAPFLLLSCAGPDDAAGEVHAGASHFCRCRVPVANLRKAFGRLFWPFFGFPWLFFGYPLGCPLSYPSIKRRRALLSFLSKNTNKCSIYMLYYKHLISASAFL